MPRGAPSNKAKLNKLIADAAKFGVTVEIPVETGEDKMAEAQAVLDFVENQKDWKSKVCRGCGKAFVYRWQRDNITCCSVRCMADELAKIGIRWDSSREPKQRWGLQIPVVVPALALELVNSRANNSTPQADDGQYTLF